MACLNPVSIHMLFSSVAQNGGGPQLGQGPLFGGGQATGTDVAEESLPGLFPSWLNLGARRKQ